MTLICVISAVMAYLIGSVNFSIILSRVVSGEDIRKSGSGNAGATNMLRTYGKKMGVLTLLLDVLKGIVVILIASAAARYANTSAQVAQGLKYICAVCVILGHNFPVYFGFKGGKGVATSLGVVLMLDWKIGLLVAAVAIAVMVATRYVSLGSIIGAWVFIVAETYQMFAFEEFSAVKLICVLVIGGLLIIRHRTNIKRLLNGTENKLGAKKK